MEEIKKEWDKEDEEWIKLRRVYIWKSEGLVKCLNCGRIYAYEKNKCPICGKKNHEKEI